MNKILILFIIATSATCIADQSTSNLQLSSHQLHSVGQQGDCESIYCLNGGECNSIGTTSVKCACDSGYIGNNCEFSIYEVIAVGVLSVLFVVIIINLIVAIKYGDPSEGSDNVKGEGKNTKNEVVSAKSEEEIIAREPSNPAGVSENSPVDMIYLDLGQDRVTEEMKPGHEYEAIRNNGRKSGEIKNGSDDSPTKEPAYVRPNSVIPGAQAQTKSNEYEVVNAKKAISFEDERNGYVRANSVIPETRAQTKSTEYEVVKKSTTTSFGADLSYVRSNSVIPGAQAQTKSTEYEVVNAKKAISFGDEENGYVRPNSVMPETRAQKKSTEYEVIKTNATTSSGTGKDGEYIPRVKVEQPYEAVKMDSLQIEPRYVRANSVMPETRAQKKSTEYEVIKTNATTSSRAGGEYIPLELVKVEQPYETVKMDASKQDPGYVRANPVMPLPGNRAQIHTADHYEVIKTNKLTINSTDQGNGYVCANTAYPNVKGSFEPKY